MPAGSQINSESNEYQILEFGIIASIENSLISACLANWTWACGGLDKWCCTLGFGSMQYVASAEIGPTTTKSRFLVVCVWLKHLILMLKILQNELILTKLTQDEGNIFKNWFLIIMTNSCNVAFCMQLRF